MKLKNALIETRGDAWVRSTAEQFGLPADEDIAVTAEQLAEKLLSEDCLKGRMLTLHDNDIRFLEYVIRSGGKLIPVRANYASADQLRNLSYAFVPWGSMTMELADELADAYAAINTPEYHELRRRTAWLYDCMTISAQIHGIISISDFCTLYRRHPDFDEPNEEIIMRLLRQLKRWHELPMEQKEGELIVKGLAETGHEAKLRILHQQVPAGIPSYSEMKDILQNGYPSRVKEYRVLKTFLIRETLVREDYASAVLELLWKLISSGNTWAEILDILHGQAVPVPAGAEETLKARMADAWEVTRMLMCNGHAPYDVLRGHRDIFLGA